MSGWAQALEGYTGIAADLDEWTCLVLGALSLIIIEAMERRWPAPPPSHAAGGEGDERDQAG